MLAELLDWIFSGIYNLLERSSSMIIVVCVIFATFDFTRVGMILGLRAY